MDSDDEFDKSAEVADVEAATELGNGSGEYTTALCND